MMGRFALMVAVTATFAGAAAAQERPASGVEQAAEITVQTWEVLQGKILGMARDFPAELFDSRPHPDSRSFVEEIWHVASGNEVLAAQIRGERVDPASLTISDDVKHDRAMMIERLSASAEECADLLRARFDARSIRTLEHMGEHYGKLVTIYRINGLVPPDSRRP